MPTTKNHHCPRYGLPSLRQRGNHEDASGSSQQKTHTGPRKIFVPVILAAWLCASCLAPGYFKVEARAQNSQQTQTEATPTPESVRGIGLYKQGDIKGAIKALNKAVKKDKNDAEAWYYLSLALNRDGDLSGARKAVEKSVKLRPSFAPARSGLAYFLFYSNKLAEALREAEAALALDSQNIEASYVISLIRLRQDDPDRALETIEAALKLKPDFSPALLVKSQVLLGLYAKRTDFTRNGSKEARAQRFKDATKLLKEAADSLEKYFQISPSPPDADVWRAQLASLRAFSQSNEGVYPNDRTIYLTDELVTRANIISRPEPRYTERARQAGVSGRVVMRAVLSWDGTVKNIIVIRSLPLGLTELAVRAAQQIKFVPAMKDGRAVSQFIQIEYNFNLY